MSQRVVVTGIGIVSPLGLGARASWSALLEGKTGVGPVRRFDASGFSTKIGAQVPDYKLNDFVPKSYRKATKVMARDIELAVIAADDALRDAGLQTRAYTEVPRINPLRFGCNIGAGLISADLDELTAAMHVARDGDQLDLTRWGSEGMSQLTPLWLLKYLPNMLACHVTIIHGLMGPSNTITCDAASSHLAIGEAFRTIQRGKADLAICGGAESRLNPMGFMRQQLLGRGSTSSNDSPRDAVRPFDVDAAGTAIGEGAGLLVVESLDHARQRGARIYAELLGFGATQDSFSPSKPDPTGYAYGRAVAAASRDANVEPGELDLLIPLGLGTPESDAAELAGLSAALGDSIVRPNFAPLRASTGHLAAGTGFDVAVAAMALHTGMVPPAINTRTVINDYRLNTAATAREDLMQLAITSTSSLGGQNAALVLRRFD